jgi:DNA helicase-4
LATFLLYSLGESQRLTFGFTALIQRGLRAIGRFLSDRPPDSLRVSGETLEYVAEGSSGSCHAREVVISSVEQSFLGLFGATVTVTLTNGKRLIVRGLASQDAERIQTEVDSACMRELLRGAVERVRGAGPRVSEALRELDSDEYLSVVQMSQWTERYGDLRFLLAMPNETIVSAGGTENLLKLRERLRDPDGWRRARNNGWLEQSLRRHRALLDSLNGVSLTDRQREAILRNDNRVLAVAGAGTGKTTTVLGKVRFLLGTGWCKPEEILLLSFARGTVDDLKDRLLAIGADAVEARTFHSLGLEIITKATGRKPAIFSDGDRGDIKHTVKQILRQMANSSESRGRVLSLLAYHFYPSRIESDFRSKRDFAQFKNANDLRSLKGERMKSNQEVKIANFLYLYGVEYVYEAEYRGSRTGTLRRRVYKPDFYLPATDTYIEHFGVDETGTPAPWIDAAEYRESMRWKRELHRDCKTFLIETFSYQDRRGDLLERLRASLESAKVRLKLRDAAELASNEELDRRHDRMAKLLGTCLTLYKGDRRSIAELESRVGSDRRAGAFFAVFKEVLRLYESMLRERGEVDFGDMIIEAADQIAKGAYRSRFRAVIVDEFQDISRGRAWLMNALLEQVPDARLLCVGDDWQSIYRFTGSDVSLMTKYKEQWPQAVRIDLDQTFRFSDKLQNVASTFVTQNPAQLTKAIRCAKSRKSPALHVVAETPEAIIRSIRARHPNASIMVLGRYQAGARQPDATAKGSDTVPAEHWLTVHKAKGREADYVIVRDLKGGYFGFPTEIQDDPLISTFLTTPEQFPNAEERRLFYVALTRARHDVWLALGDGDPSVFVQELLTDPRYKNVVETSPAAGLVAARCPKCDCAMRKRKNRQDGSCFLGCVEFPVCNGKQRLCPQCENAIPVKTDQGAACPATGCGWRKSGHPARSARPRS